MNDHQKEFPVGKMCKVFKVSRSGYYAWRRHVPSERDGENRVLLSEIRRIHKRSKATYGSPRMTKELRANGFDVSRPRVARLMSKNGIRAVHAKKFKATTDSEHRFPVVPNRLDRDFAVSEMALAWVSDITYIRTAKGWLYLTVVIDLFDRKVVGWSLSTDMTAKATTVAAWKMAVANRTPTEGLIFHSDRGIQYACGAFTNLLDSYANVKRSMSRKGDCWDNAVAESFFKSLKVELVYRNRFKTVHRAALAIFEWIETWYNTERRHSALGYMTIKEFEKSMQFKNVA